MRAAHLPLPSEGVAPVRAPEHLGARRCPAASARGAGVEDLARSHTGSAPSRFSAPYLREGAPHVGPPPACAVVSAARVGGGCLSSEFLWLTSSSLPDSHFCSSPSLPDALRTGPPSESSAPFPSSRTAAVLGGGPFFGIAAASRRTTQALPRFERSLSPLPAPVPRHPGLQLHGAGAGLFLCRPDDKSPSQEPAPDAAAQDAWEELLKTLGRRFPHLFGSKPVEAAFVRWARAFIRSLTEGPDDESGGEGE